ncbi:MAG TPA: hypothetical protein PLD12_11995 [Bacteroidales bacterium]|nr:hypothetical protein [Bacteroidales bacterium]HPO66658.1 hypothetical protein [Bacteroidales bacterium]
MAIELQQFIAAYCAELLRAHSSFLVLQRSAYVEMLGSEFNRLALDNNHFLGLDEVTLSMYLRPRRRSRLVAWWYRLQRRPLLPVYELVSSMHPEAIQCTIVFRREGSAYTTCVAFDNKTLNENIYVDLT